MYRHAITPARVAELLILRGDMPRSLLACLAEVERNLKAVANKQSGETERRAMMHAELRFTAASTTSCTPACTPT